MAKLRDWIDEAIKKEGALHRQLGIPKDQRIPTTLLLAIKRAPVGKKIVNPTKVGYKRIKVTPLLKKRVNLALTLRSFHKPKRKNAKRRKR